jgi:ornithine carbamoyltransferase
MFDKPSTRTRLSTATAAHRLGMDVHVVDTRDLQLSRGESPADTARAISLYVDLIVYRTFDHARLEEFAEAAMVPVVNALTNEHHPCQALADVLTIEERFGSANGVKVAFIGDATGNVASSLGQAAAMLGMDMAIAAPKMYWPDPLFLDSLGSLGPGRVACFEDPEEAITGADVVYPEVWVPMDKEHERDVRERHLAPYSVDETRMRLAGASAILLHCLPAFREQEVAASVLDGPASAVWDQALNRLPTTQALIHHLLVGP